LKLEKEDFTSLQVKDAKKKKLLLVRKFLENFGCLDVTKADYNLLSSHFLNSTLGLTSKCL